ncbi:hypothetical protein HDU96_006898 [Phlyctochytrium bullatum]|nr:hypothetical protein HDU96_006898 [Phlyctochytrium bullatum]
MLVIMQMLALAASIVIGSDFANVIAYSVLINSTLAAALARLGLKPVLEEEPPQGQLYQIKNEVGDSDTVHVYCKGEATSAPTLWFLGPIEGGVSAFYGIQDRLSSANWRTCSYDNLGNGWSSNTRRGYHDLSLLYPKLINVADAGRRAVFIAWGNAGSFAVKFAQSNPSKVAALIMVESFPPEIEVDEYKQNRKINSPSVPAFRQELFRTRLVTRDAILFGGVPFPFISLIFPDALVPKGYEPEESKLEFRVQRWKGKLHAALFWNLNQLQNADPSQDPVNTLSLNRTVTPLTHIICNITDAQACSDDQNNYFWAIPRYDNETCDQWQARHRFYRERQVAMTLKIQPDARIVENKDGDCRTDLTVNKPAFVASAILDALRNLTVS